MLPVSTTVTDPLQLSIQLSFLEALVKAELARQREVVRARRYHDGDHPTFLSPRLKEFLNITDSETAFRLNACRIVVSAVNERLIVKALDCADPQGLELATQTWMANKCDILSDDIEDMALTDGESFVVLDWDSTTKRVLFLPHERYTDMTLEGGDGFGVAAVYENDDINQPMRYAVKRWVEGAGTSDSRVRATFYWPDKIEKFAYQYGWKPVMDESDLAWPLESKGADGKPLGIPVVHFRNQGLRPEARDAWPLQDALNKSLIDLIGAADVHGFPMLKVFGFTPTTDGKAVAEDGSNLLKVGPGRFIGSTKPPGEASLDTLQPGDLAQLRNLIGDFIHQIAIVTDTPPARFRSSAQVAAEGTLKQQDEPLIAKVEKRQMLFGDAWARVFAMARRMSNAFGGTRLDETAEYTVLWEAAVKRTDQERHEEWKIKRDVGHIPLRQLWREMGYDDQKIEEMLNDPEIKALTFAQYP